MVYQSLGAPTITLRHSSKREPVELPTFQRCGDELYVKKCDCRERTWGCQESALALKQCCEDMFLLFYRLGTLEGNDRVRFRKFIIVFLTRIFNTGLQWDST